MSKQKIEIEVDVPEGWEATGECRLPKAGEYYLCNGGTARAGWDFISAMSLIIRKLPPKPTFPDWFPSGWWIARDENGKWHAYSAAPRSGVLQWYPRSASLSYMPLRDMSTFANLPDASVPWTECCYQCVRSEE